MNLHVRRPIAAVLGFLVALSVVALPGATAIDLPRAVEDPLPNPNFDHPAENPDLETACGLNILMILDESTSISNAGAVEDVRDAFKAFTDALKNTASSMAVAEFSTVADLPIIGGFAPGDYITITDATKVELDNYVDTGYSPMKNPTMYTNWEDGLRTGNPNFAVRPDPTVPHLTVFITDGDPNRIIRSLVSTVDYENKMPLSTFQVNSSNEDTGAEAAVANANGIKAQGSHILAIAVGDGLSSGSSIDRLELVSGPDIYDGTGTFDIVTDDIYVEPNFDELADALREAAFQLCAPSITIQKLVDDTPDPDSLDDAYPGAGWSITGTPTVPGGFEWVVPANGTGPSTPPSMTTLTDGAGFATFQWNTLLPESSEFVATEVVQPGYTNDQSRSVCTFRTPESPDADLPLDTVGDGTFSVTIPTEAIVTCTIVNVAVPAPGITLEKATNDADADVPEGLRIPVGDAVEWTYVVTNTGNTVLNDISLVDSEVLPAAATGPVVSCPSTTLDQGASMTCTASGTSGTLAAGGDFIGQYGNNAEVTATDSFGTEVDATDPSHYFVAAPGISVEKSTNGDDADLAPGPFIVPGDPVNWHYVITNTGTEELNEVTLVDSIEGDIVTKGTCDWPHEDGGPLHDGEIVTCDLVGTALTGQYENIVTTTGVDPDQVIVSHSDPSHYFGATSGIAIEKATNNQDADDPYPDPDVPVVEIGSTVYWTYVVTNTGNLPLASWTVIDDQGVSVGCPKIILGPGASATCSASGTAVEGEYANTGTVTAPDPLGGDDLEATDPSHYFAPSEDITIEKHTNTEDADSPTGPFIPNGDPVEWTYLVTNTGTSTLTDVIVFDHVLGDITSSCIVQGEAPPWDRELAPGESAICLQRGTAVPDQYFNVAIAIGSGPFNDVGWFDPSHYFGTVSDIIINKYTNGSDADAAPGIYVPIGDPIEWTYNVANVGNNALSAIAVTDDLEGDISCNFTTLAVGEQGVCTLDGGPAILGQYSNVGSVTAIDSAENPLSDDDPSNYFGYLSEIVVEKATNGEDADTPTGPMVQVGDPVTWTYVVTNPGNVELTDIALTDDKGVVPVYIDGDTNGDGILAPNNEETWTYEATGVAEEGQYANVATATGLDLFQDEATDTDPSHYLGFVSEIDIEKSTNGDDADTPIGPTIEVGDPVTWTYVVTNPGTVPLENVTVTDDKGVVPVYVSGDTSGDDLLDPGEVWIFEASDTAVAGQYANIGSVTGVDPAEQTLEATDPSHYLGFGAGIDVEKATNGDDADSAPGIQITVGDPVLWTYVLTNPGDVALSNIVLVDDQGVVPAFIDGDTDADGLLDVDETWTYEGTGTAVAGQYTNLASVTGVVTAPEDPSAAMTFAVGDSITDEDPSNYFGFLAGIDVEKATNGIDADTAPGVEILVGDPVTWTYVVTNTGDSPIAEVMLTDDQGEVPILLGGDTNGDSLLDPDETWTFEAKGTSTEGQYTNIGTVTGIDPAGAAVTDQDPSNYKGVKDGLPVTGVETGLLGFVALLLLGAGVLLVRLTRSKKVSQKTA